MFKGFKNFLMRGDVVVVAIGLMVALAVSTLVQAFTTDIINPLLNRAQGGNSIGLGVQLGQTGNQKTFWDWGAFISAIIYFVIFMTILYFAIVIPYKYIQARRG
ncbi:MAG: MscL family protein [Acidimicrobiaceae bacterium]|nr:MscL family protein [Acidimicrobiaceae bacterium]